MAQKTEPKPDKVIAFPAVNARREVKLRNFLRVTGDFMDVTLEVEPVTVLNVKVPADRGDVFTIVRNAAQQEKKRPPDADDEDGSESESSAKS